MLSGKIEQMLLRHEGYRKYPYRCTAGRLTVGIGRNLEDRGMSEDEACYLLRNDIDECRIDLRKIFGKVFDALTEKRQNVLIDMRFNLGAGGFRKFKRMIAAVKRGSFKRAVWEMKHSLWCLQVKGRCFELAEMMKEI